MSDMELIPASDDWLAVVAQHCGTLAARFCSPTDEYYYSTLLYIDMLARIDAERKRDDDQHCDASYYASRYAEEKERADAAEQDAARYRWLRDVRNDTSICLLQTALYTEVHSGDKLDSIIDAAMKEKEPT